MLTRDEYRARASREGDWAPGWEAIDGAFAAVYPGVVPAHLATLLPARAAFGGPEHLDGVSVFPNPDGYQHLVTYGLTRLYVDEESFGGAYSGWGYELTLKLRAVGPDDCGWAVAALGGLARYTATSGRWFEPFQFVDGRGRPLDGDASALTGFLVVPDTEVAGIPTLHGRVDFLQLVGVTQAEVDWIAETPETAPDRARELARLLADGNPRLVTDLARGTAL